MAKETVAVSAEAPDFVLESQRGERIRLSDFRGTKKVVLVFLRGFF